MYTDERCCWLLVELADVVVIDILLPPAVVVDELLFSAVCKRHCEAKTNN